MSQESLQDLDLDAGEKVSGYSSSSDYFGDQYKSRSFWVCLFIAVLFIVMVFIVAGYGKEWNGDLNNNWTWTKECNYGLLGILLIFVLLLATFVAWLAYERSSSPGMRKMIMVTSGICVILLGVMFPLFFLGHKIKTVFIMSLFLAFFSLLLTYYLWTVDSRAGLGMVPYLVWLGTVVFLTWHLHKENDGC